MSYILFMAFQTFDAVDDVFDLTGYFGLSLMFVSLLMASDCARFIDPWTVPTTVRSAAWFKYRSDVTHLTFPLHHTRRF